MKADNVIGALMGVAVGDAMGVPHEFKSRSEMRKNPVTSMVGHGTYNQPLGTWSDDSSLTFCLAESLLNGYDLKDIAEKFIQWRSKAYWTARGRVFDIGMTTAKALNRLEEILDNNWLDELQEQKNYGDAYENGNGSLMRIIPLLFYIKGKTIQEQFSIIWEVSALTHRHIRAAMSCLIYLKLAEKLLSGQDKIIAYTDMQKEILAFWEEIHFPKSESQYFEKIIQNDIRNTALKNIKTGGYVIEVLESSLWFFLNRNSYKETILSSINLGHDTDTGAAIAGGLAGLYYGLKGIPELWVASIARMEDIIQLGKQLHSTYI
ncbi:MAG: ADP-ribosylglycohydrolase family protein [Saprospiraceae bacterium]|nr:ADP-ribosylglycohydrolase family protein [Saprospiraceae bacterium]